MVGTIILMRNAQRLGYFGTGVGKSTPQTPTCRNDSGRGLAISAIYIVFLKGDVHLILLPATKLGTQAWCGTATPWHCCWLQVEKSCLSSQGFCNRHVLEGMTQPFAFCRWTGSHSAHTSDLINVNPLWFQTNWITAGLEIHMTCSAVVAGIQHHSINIMGIWVGNSPFS